MKPRADKSRVVLFVAIILQSLLAAAILMLALPYYVWGPAPADEVALNTYSNNAQSVARLIAALWAGVVCLAYYFCFMRQHR